MNANTAPAAGELLEEPNDFPFMRNELLIKESPPQRVSLSPTQVVRHYGQYLSEFEKLEIIDYDEIYTFGRNCAKLVASRDAIKLGTYQDESKRYRATIGDHIGYRFKINAVAGEGTYAQVFRCTDEKLARAVAVKIQKKNHPMLYDETRMLMAIHLTDLNDESNCIRIHYFNNFRGFHYLVVDEYETDLYRFVRNVEYALTTLDTISRMAETILKGLAFLRKRELIHGDLKPSNILLNSWDPARLKITDFGISVFLGYGEGKRVFQTLQFRAPEMFCGAAPSLEIDMWSFGCILGEMILSATLLPGLDIHDQFFLIQETLGTPTHTFFNSQPNVNFYFHSVTRQPRHCIRVYNANVDTFMLQVDRNNPNVAPHRKIPGATPLFSVFFLRTHHDVLDLIEKVLVWDGTARLKPEAALDHPFISRMVYFGVN